MESVKLVTVNDLRVGDEVSSVKTITMRDITLFAGIVGDWNPFHFDEAFCKDTPFGARIVHGMLLGGLISGILGSKLLPGGLYVKQTLNFKRPVYVGDTVKTTVVVKEIDYERNRVVLETTCCVIAGDDCARVVVFGEAIASPYVERKNENSRSYSCQDGKHQAPW